MMGIGWPEGMGSMILMLIGRMVEGKDRGNVGKCQGGAVPVLDLGQSGIIQDDRLREPTERY
jgi:hypothetical protein